MTNYGGARKNTGPKTKAEKGELKHIPRCISFPPDLYTKILAAMGKDEKFSHFICKAVETHFAAEEAEVLK